jgi:Fe-S-cluster containining protein
MKKNNVIKECLDKTDKNAGCSFLRFNRDGTTSCVIYRSRPRFCREFPNNPNDTLPECSFKFVQKE